MFRRREGRGSDRNNETRLVTNPTSRVITLGDIDNFEINPGKTIDLLRVASIQRIGSSVDLKSALNMGWLILKDRDNVNVNEGEVKNAIIPAVLRDTDNTSETESGDIIANELIRDIVTVTDDYTVTESNDIILANAVNITVTLPSAEDLEGYHFVVKKITSSTGNVTVAAYDNETIDGNDSVNIATQYNSITMVSDGSNWYIV